MTVPATTARDRGDLDRLRTDLERRVQECPKAGLPALMALYSAMVASAAARLAQGAEEPRSSREAPEHNLSVREAARVLGVSPGLPVPQCRQSPLHGPHRSAPSVLSQGAGAVEPPSPGRIRGLDI